MKRYIKSSADTNTNANMFYLSQDELRRIRDNYINPADTHTSRYDLSPEDRYDLAAELAQEDATPDNFYKNSVGFWTPKSAPPKRPADHTSAKWYRSDYDSSNRSEYWYTPKGIYRRSNHWGSDVASCSWYIEGRRYRKEGIVKGNRETAFIAWGDLKPLGTIAVNTKEQIEASANLQKIFAGMTLNDVMYRPIGFRFEK